MTPNVRDINRKSFCPRCDELYQSLLKSKNDPLVQRIYPLGPNVVIRRRRFRVGIYSIQYVKSRHIALSVHLSNLLMNPFSFGSRLSSLVDAFPNTCPSRRFRGSGSICQCANDMEMQRLPAYPRLAFPKVLFPTSTRSKSMFIHCLSKSSCAAGTLSWPVTFCFLRTGKQIQISRRTTRTARMTG